MESITKIASFEDELISSIKYILGFLNYFLFLQNVKVLLCKLYNFMLLPVKVCYVVAFKHTFMHGITLTDGLVEWKGRNYKWKVLDIGILRVWCCLMESLILGP